MTKKVLRNFSWNLAGTGINLAIGVLALPMLLRLLGAEAVGLFTLALGLIGFSGVFDLGLGRALTRAVAANPDRDVAAYLVWRAALLLAITGIAMSCLAFWGLPRLAGMLPAVHGPLANQAAFGFEAVALSIPFSALASAAIGTLEGLQLYPIINIGRVSFGALQFILPVITALWRADIGMVIAALALARAVAGVCWMIVLHANLPWRRSGGIASENLSRILRFGGWILISSIVGPFMVYADRFYLAAVLPLGIVSAYTLPYEGVTRIASLATTATAVIFPALAQASLDAHSRQRLIRDSGDAVIPFALITLIILQITAPELVHAWLGSALFQSSLPVFRILLVGTFVNVIAQIPFALLQAKGRADLTAKLHVVELPVFALTLFLCVHTMGVVGAAVAWTLRALGDAVALICIAIALDSEARTALRLLAARATVSTLALTMAGVGGALGFAGALAAAVIFLSDFPGFRRRMLPSALKPTRRTAQDWPPAELESVDACPACAQRPRETMHVDLLDVEFGAAGFWTMYRCRGCGSGYLDPRPSAASIGAAYANYYTHTDSDRPLIRRRGIVRRLLHDLVLGYQNSKYGLARVPSLSAGRILIPLLPPLRSAAEAELRCLPRCEGRKGRLLDVGCGGGSFLLLSQQAGWQATGVDVDPHSVAIARKQGLDARLGGIDSLDRSEQGTFDLVTLSHVVEHVTDPLDLLRRAHAMLKPGGALWLETPNVDAPGHARFQSAWRGLEPPRHLCLLSRTALLDILAKAGYSEPTFLRHGLTAASVHMSSVRIARRLGVSVAAIPFVGALLAELTEWLASRGHGEYLTIIAKRP